MQSMNIQDVITQCRKVKDELNKIHEEYNELRDIIINFYNENGKCDFQTPTHSVHIDENFSCNEAFIQLMRDRGYSSLIKETCIPTNFKKVCEELGLTAEEQVSYQNQTPSYYLKISPIKKSKKKNRY